MRAIEGTAHPPQSTITHAWQNPPVPLKHALPPPPPQQPKLLDRLRDALRSRHYSRRTEQCYCQWACLPRREPSRCRQVKRFIFFHKVRHPAEMSEPEINAFLTMLPESVKEPLRKHLSHVRDMHQRDLASGYGRVFLPYALSRKYPNAATEWVWQWVFPQENRWLNPGTGAQGESPCG